MSLGTCTCAQRQMYEEQCKPQLGLAVAIQYEINMYATDKRIAKLQAFDTVLFAWYDEVKNKGKRYMHMNAYVCQCMI